jgi:hypothetical protein
MIYVWSMQTINFPFGGITILNACIQKAVKSQHTN